MFLCKLLGHSWKRIGEVVVFGPGEYLGKDSHGRDMGSAMGFPERCIKYECQRCGKEKYAKLFYEDNR